MDFWAGLDHQLIYKRGLKEAKLIGQELYEYAQIVEELDQKNGGATGQNRGYLTKMHNTTWRV